MFNQLLPANTPDDGAADEITQLLGTLQLELATAQMASPPSDSLNLAALRSALQPYLPAHPYPSHLRLTYQRPPPPPLPPAPAPDPAFKYTTYVTPSNQFAPYIPRPPPRIHAWGNYRLPMEIFEMVVEVMVRDRQMRSLIKLMRTNSAVYLMAVKVMFRHEEQLDGAGLAKHLGEATRLETLGVDAFFGSMRQRCEFALLNLQGRRPEEIQYAAVPLKDDARFWLGEAGDFSIGEITKYLVRGPPPYARCPLPDVQRITFTPQGLYGPLSKCTLYFDKTPASSPLDKPRQTIRCITGSIAINWLTDVLGYQIWTRPLQSLSLHLDNLYNRNFALDNNTTLFPSLVPPVHVNHITISLPCHIGKPAPSIPAGSPPPALADRLHVLYVWLNMLARRSIHPVVVEIVGAYAWWDLEGVPMRVAGQDEDGLLRKPAIRAPGMSTSHVDLYDRERFCFLPDRNIRLIKILRKIDRLELVDRCTTIAAAVSKHTSSIEAIAVHAATTSAPLGRPKTPIGKLAPDNVYVVFSDIRPWIACAGCGLYMASRKPHEPLASGQGGGNTARTRTDQVDMAVYRWVRAR